LNIAFVLTLVAWWSGFDFSNGLMHALTTYPGLHIGLALASSVTAWLNAGLLWHHLNRIELAPTVEPKQFWAVAVAGSVMATGLVLLVPDAQVWVAWTLIERVAQLLMFVMFGAAVFAATLLLFGLRARDFQRPSDAQTR